MGTTYSGRTFNVGDTVYFTKYWQNMYSTAAAGVYSGQYSFYATVKALNTASSSVTHPIQFTSLHNTSGTITGGGGYLTPSEVTKGYQVKVTYNHNGGSGTASQTGYVGASLTGTSSRTGYTFAGWYTAASGGSKVTTIPTDAKTYYAHWTAKKYTVTLNNQGATTAGSTSVSATYGSAMPSITKPTRTGYVFGGYYTGTNGSGTQYYTAAGASARSYSTAGTMTLYAKWTPITYSVAFNGNGALSGSMSAQSFTYDEAQALTANAFSKGVAYAFTGWNTQPDGSGTTYTDGQSVSNLTATSGGTVNLYAQWELQYLAPTITNLTALRYANGAESDDGTQIHVEFTWAVDTIVSASNYATSVKIQYKAASDSTWTMLQNTTYSSQTAASLGGTVSYTSAAGVANTDVTYDILVSITDYYGTSISITAPQASAQTFLSQAFFMVDWSPTKGMGIGTPAPTTGLRVGVDTEFTGDLSGVDAAFSGDETVGGTLTVTEGATIGALDDGYGINDEAILSAATIAKIDALLGNS